MERESECDDMASVVRLITSQGKGSTHYLGSMDMRWGFPSQCSGGSGTGSTPCANRRDALGRASLVAPLGEASGPYIHFGPFRARVRANLRGARDATPLQGKFGGNPR